MMDWRTMAMMSLAGALVLSANACSGVRDSLGFGKRPPDEFTVVRKPPLVIPPNFSLRPPATADLEGETETIGKAKQALFGQSSLSASSNVPAPPPVKSVGEQALLTRAGAENVNPGIRRVILRETTLLEEKDRSFTERLIFWQKEQPPSQTVDARKEAERLRQAAATGKSPTSGQTPSIQRRKRAFLEGIF
jgi:hypothetical protein